MLRPLLVLALCAGSAFAEPGAPSLARADAVAAIGIEVRQPVTGDQLQLLIGLVEQGPSAEELHLLAKAYANNSYAATKDAKRYLLDAVKTFKRLLDDDKFRSYDKRDAALFEYAWLLASARYMKETRAVLDKLVKEHAASSWIASGHVLFGDYAFDAKDFAEAEARYTQALAASPRYPVQAYATYKLAWVHAMRAKHGDAVALMAKVRQLGRGTALERAARTDLAELASAQATTQPEHWLSTAEAFGELASDASTPRDRARTAALASAQAYRNALGLPASLEKLAALPARKKKTPLSKTERARLDVHALYQVFVESTEAELGTLRFVEAVVHRTHGDHASARAVLVEYLREHPDAPGVAFAKKMLGR